MKKLSFILLPIMFLMACNDNKPAIYEGSITIAVDQSIEPIISEQIKIYKIQYPKASIIMKVMPENKGIFQMFQDSVTLVAATREFNKEELASMAKREIRYVPARMAIDAVALVVNSNSTDSKLTLPQLKSYFENGKKLIFDSGSSANLNLVKQKLGLDSINLENVFGVNGNLEVLAALRKNPDAIGFVGYNWIGDRDDPDTEKRMQGLKFVALEKPKTGAYFEPNRKNLADRNYAFERFIYLHTFNKEWGIENGFIRHCCSKIGQLVIEKMGLIPFYIIPKEFQLDTKAPNYKPAWVASMSGFWK